MPVNFAEFAGAGGGRSAGLASQLKKGCELLALASALSGDKNRSRVASYTWKCCDLHLDTGDWELSGAPDLKRPRPP